MESLNWKHAILRHLASAKAGPINRNLTSQFLPYTDTEQFGERIGSKIFFLAHGEESNGEHSIIDTESNGHNYSISFFDITDS